MFETTNSSGWDISEALGDLWDRGMNYLDHMISDSQAPAAGGEYLGGISYPERTPPAPAAPVDPWFQFGNNAQTWAAGLGLIAAVALVALVVRK